MIDVKTLVLMRSEGMKVMMRKLGGMSALACRRERGGGTAQIASHPRSGQVPFDRVDRHLVP